VSGDLVTDVDSTLFGETASATFSADRAYRYALTRTWADGPPAVFAMLNPSTAGAFVLDPTVRRCVGFARAWGCGGLLVLNAFGLCSTDPRALDRHPDPVGPANDDVIRAELAAAARRAGGGRLEIVAAWGAAPAVRRAGRDAVLCAAVREVTGQVLGCLGATRDGSPRHPLYVPASAYVRAWTS